MAEGLTRKQIKELRKLEKLQSRNIDKQSNNIKWIAIAIVSVLFLVLFVGIIIVAKNKNKPTTADGSTSFASNGHERAIKSTKPDASTSADKAPISLTLVEYADFQCPACKATHPMVKQLLETFPDQLKLSFKNFPLVSIHPNALDAAIAAEAVNKQGKYFEYVDLLYEKQGEWAGLTNPDDKFAEYAKAIGVDVVKFKEDLKDPIITALIKTHQDEGIKNGVTGTPSFFLNGERVTTPGDFETFKKLVASALIKLQDESKPQSSTTPKSGQTQQESGASKSEAVPTSIPDRLPLQQ